MAVYSWRRKAAQLSLMACSTAQGRGDTFIDAGAMVYAGMIVGSHRREGDIEINVCKEKKLTNMRSSTADVSKRLNLHCADEPRGVTGVHL